MILLFGLTHLVWRVISGSEAFSLNSLSILTLNTQGNDCPRFPTIFGLPDDSIDVKIRIPSTTAFILRNSYSSSILNGGDNNDQILHITFNIDDQTRYVVQHLFSLMNNCMVTCEWLVGFRKIPPKKIESSTIVCLSKPISFSHMYIHETANICSPVNGCKRSVGRAVKTGLDRH